MTIPFFGVVGWNNSGKTRLMVKLIAAFTYGGMTISAVKHAHHAFDVDHGGRDFLRYRAAGSRTVALFGLDDVKAIADFILDYHQLRRTTRSPCT